MRKIVRLGEFEQKVLWTLVRLRGEAYGMQVRRELAERTGKDISIGAVYATLDRLEGKGLVSSWRGEPVPERGGRARRYFQVEAAGLRAIEQARETLTRAWQGLRPVGSRG